VLGEPATATDQPHKPARLLVRESPGLPSLAVLDHNPSIVADNDLKRAGREGYSHRAPSLTSSGGRTHHHSGRYRKVATSPRLRAFDTYRAETLKRLEEEQRSFREYLERLPQTKYRAEFEQFIQQRRAQQPQA